MLMITFNNSPSQKEKQTLIHMLKWHRGVFPMIKAKVEENKFAAIYDENILCGGALIWGNKTVKYLYCFFENSEYCNKQNLANLESVIAATFPETVLFDVHCLKDYSFSYSKNIIKNR